MKDIYSIGHSNLTTEALLRLLDIHQISTIADVRSAPFSRKLPHFNRDSLRESLARCGIGYVFLGAELGGRPSNEFYLDDGVADYEAMARSDEFALGILHLEAATKAGRVAMLCSEREPLECHRCLLIGRSWSELGGCVHHILHGGGLRSQTECERQLKSIAFGKKSEDPFFSNSAYVGKAYSVQSHKVAYRRNKVGMTGS